MIFADTNILSLVEQGRPVLTQKILAARDTKQLAVPIIACLEVLRGRYEAIWKAANADELIRMQARLSHSEAFLSTFQIIPIDAAAGQHFEHLRRLKGMRGIRRGDLLIACIILAHNATLVTRNLKDFAPIPNLRTENWAD